MHDTMTYKNGHKKSCSHIKTRVENDITFITDYSLQAIFSHVFLKFDLYASTRSSLFFFP